MHKLYNYAATGLLLFIIIFLPISLQAYPQHTPHWTKVEQIFLASSGRQPGYSHEYAPVIETRNQYELGKLTAMRFIEWAKDHPNGVIALSNGNTPEYFIKFLRFYKKNWHKPHVQAELQSFGIKLKSFPDTSNLKFVQIEESYPLSASHYKSVSNYLKRHYIQVLGIKKQNTLLMDLTSKGIIAEKGLKVVFMSGKVDLSIMHHKPSSQLEAWQQQAIKELRAFCAEYENKIRAWGGIDFFVGTLSYGGHFGSIPPGSAFDSKTQIVKLDYMSAAHAAKDMGGIEHARGKINVTIGMGSISLKPNAVLIISAAGESKAEVVRDSVENQITRRYPATILQRFPNARFYVTAGAAKLLDDRRTEDVQVKTKFGWTQALIREVVIEIAQAESKAILMLTPNDLEKYARGRLLLENPPKPLAAMLLDVHNNLIRHIENGIKISATKAKKILHTGPHHDDIMLGYYPVMDVLSFKFQNNFAYLTSGYNSVSDAYIMSILNRASDWWLNKEENNIFRTSYDKIINKFINYYVKQDIEQMALLDTTIALRHLVSVYDIKNLDQLKQTIRWLKDDYFPNKHPGNGDEQNIKLLKGMMRESEVDRMWSLKNFSLHNVHHLRSEFYNGKEFAKTPGIDTDVLPFLRLYNEFKPDIITVADDPNSAPPVTHYKVLQIIAQALRHKDAVAKENLQIWGYRNVWFRYRVQDANMLIPVSEQMLENQRKVFLACFNTQKEASFPSPFFEGDFSALSAKIQREQYATLNTLLGEEYFTKNLIPEIRNAVGFIYMNRMTLDQFFQRAEDLQHNAEVEDFFAGDTA